MKGFNVRLVFVFFVLCLSTIAMAQSTPIKFGQNNFVDSIIANGQTVGNATDLGGFTMVGFFVPASFTGTTVTFQAAQTLNGTYGPVRDSTGTPISIAVAAGAYQAVNHTSFYGVRYLRVVSGSAEAAQRTVRLSLKAF